MGFRFSLEAVLRVRRSMEDGERIRLQSLLVERAQLQTRITETIASRAGLGATLNASLQHERLSAGELHFSAQRVRSCDLQSARLNESVATLTPQIERQQATLLRRRIDRKVLEQLRERQRTRYEADTQRRAQSQVEELFLLRRDRNSN